MSVEFDIIVLCLSVAECKKREAQRDIVGGRGEEGKEKRDGEREKAATMIKSYQKTGPSHDHTQFSIA